MASKATPLGKKIYMHRCNREMTQEQLAEALDVSRFAVQRWEAGDNVPHARFLQKIAAFFGTTTDELMED